MSVSDDLLIAAHVTLAELANFLTETCGLEEGDPDNLGMPTFHCDHFSCFVSRLSPDQRGIFEEGLGMSLVWRLEFYVHALPYEDGHPKMIETIQLAMLEYDVDCAWLNNCSVPTVIKRNNVVTITANESPYSKWSAILLKFAEDLGLEYEVKRMPPI